MALLKSLKLLLIPVVIMYSCVILYMFDAISYERQGPKTAKVLFDRNSPLAPNHRQVLLSRYESRNGRREFDDYPVYADQDGVNYGKGIDKGKDLCYATMSDLPCTFVCVFACTYVL